MKRLLSAIGALLMPQNSTCHLCGAFLEAGETLLCARCQGLLNYCRIEPFEAVVSLDENCHAVSAYWHEEEAWELVIQLKFGHDRAAALPLVQGLCAAYEEQKRLFPERPTVLPVPCHPDRVRERGYAQAEVLARAFCEMTGLPLDTEGLTRVRSGSQLERNRNQRLTAMEGAFAATRDFIGEKILLLDDVYTTGATALACVNCLRAAGCEETAVLTVCRA